MVALTVATVRARLGPRLGPYVALADLDDALAGSLVDLARAPADPLSPVDADLLAVEAAEVNQFFDVALARAWETVLANLTADLLREAGWPAEVDVEAERRHVRAIVTEKTKLILDRYGIGLTAPSAGVIGLDFQASGNDTVI